MTEIMASGEAPAPSHDPAQAMSPPAEDPPSAGGSLLAVIERLATTPGLNIDVFERLLNVRRLEEDRAAARAFNAAMSLAKGELGPVLKTHDVDFQSKKEGAARTKYKYEDFADVARAVDPVFHKHGLSYRFRVSQTGKIVKVTTVVSHALGHSEETAPLEAEVDPGSTGMSPVQALGAALTYLQRYSLRASIGLAAGKDNDGRLEGSPPIEADQIHELADLIRDTGSSEVTLLRLMGVGSIPELRQDQFTRAKEVLKLRKANITSRDNANPAGDA